MAVTLRWNMTDDDRRLIFKAVLTLVLFAALAAALVLPARRRLAEVDADIARTRGEIARQQALLPVLLKLKQAKSKEDAGSFGFPARAPLARTQLQNLPGMGQKVAESAGLTVLELNLDAASVLAERNRIQVQGVFSGSLSQFRIFFVALQNEPSLNRVEKVEVRAVSGGLEFYMQMRFALA
jgi:hypothetical protein